MVTSEVLGDGLKGCSVIIGDETNQYSRVVLHMKTEEDAYILEQTIRNLVIGVEVVA